ncbi:YozE family protein [Planctomonas psychrotolerans]|uniref:YozE family protein n=1 Tax=Planctomonas psychrotolerans TaxID=2528712 RepID=UPI0012395775|nr:YozE family protein [Planctomonas psychrotolerans]
MTHTFPDWLAAQNDRGDVVSELAADVAARSDFPENGGKPIYEGYFEAESDELQAAFQRAWDEYESHADSATA